MKTEPKAPPRQLTLREVNKILLDLKIQHDLLNDEIDLSIKKIENFPEFSVNFTPLETLLKNIEYKKKVVEDNVNLHKSMTKTIKKISEHQQIKIKILRIIES